MSFKDLIPWHRTSRRHIAETEQDAFSGLQHEINRVFESFRRDLDSFPFLGLSEAEGAVGPRIDVCETADGIQVKAELPGIDEKDVDLSLSGNTLVIRGEKRSESEETKKDYYIKECSRGSFQRAIPLPPGVDFEKATAKFKKGVLVIDLPRTAEAREQTRKIEVTTADG